jgi:hypothetical protein
MKAAPSELEKSIYIGHEPLTLAFILKSSSDDRGAVYELGIAESAFLSSVDARLLAMP